MAERVDYLYKAQLDDQAERYDEMVESMKKIATLGGDLTVEERNLFSVAYKCALEPRKKSWKAIHSLEQEQKYILPASRLQFIRQYRLQIETELKDICRDVLDVLETHLIPTITLNGEFEVFYYKMQGDYYRYLAEFDTTNDEQEVTKKALVAYKRATAKAKRVLRPTHLIRLSLALNFSVFYDQILKYQEQAYDHDSDAFERALVELTSLSEQGQNECVVILQMLRDKLTLWRQGSSNVLPW